MKVILNEEQLRTIIKEMTSDEIDVRANEAASDPTDPQKEAGNYKMGHISVKGMKIAIENPKGSYRKFKKEDGTTGQVEMQNHYGYFNVTKGKDGDAVDVFIGPNIENFENVYCVDQNVVGGHHGVFDETKVMLGFNSKEEAKEAYMSNYSPGWTGFRAITSVSLPVFKKWLYRGRKQRQPFADYVEIQKKKLDEVKTWNEDQHKIFQKQVDEIKDFILSLEGHGGLSDVEGVRLGYRNVKRNYSRDWLISFYGGGTKNDRSPKYSFLDKAVARAISELKAEGVELRYYQGI